jgi:hypothetical protein
MRRPDVRGSRQIGNRAGLLEHTVVGARRETQPARRRLHQVLAGFVERQCSRTSPRGTAIIRGSAWRQPELDQRSKPARRQNIHRKLTALFARQETIVLRGFGGIAQFGCAVVNHQGILGVQHDALRWLNSGAMPARTATLKTRLPVMRSASSTITMTQECYPHRCGVRVTSDAA